MARSVLAQWKSSQVSVKAVRQCLLILAANTSFLRAQDRELSATDKRDEPADALLVTPVGIAKQLQQIFFLKSAANHDIQRAGHGEHQSPDGHVRRRPEGHQKTGIHRVSHDSVQKRGFERGIGCF